MARWARGKDVEGARCWVVLVKTVRFNSSARVACDFLICILQSCYHHVVKSLEMNNRLVKRLWMYQHRTGFQKSVVYLKMPEPAGEGNVSQIDDSKR